MIARLQGQIKECKDLAVILDVGGIFYEICVPVSVMKRLEEMNLDEDVVLMTHHYLQMGPSTATPVLVGFLNDLERDFFLQFISVSGIGPKKAVKALDRSISEIAIAIDNGDINFLKSLPGIGQQKAKDIVAKLQGKVGHFGLIQDKSVKKAETSSVAVAIQEEALAVLLQLQYKKIEAQDMITKALERQPEAGTVEDLLNEIYKQRVLT